MLVHKWLEAAIAHSGLNGPELAHLLTERLGRKFDRSIIAKMRTPPPSPGADPSHPDSRRVRRAIKVDELFAIAQITGYPVHPDLLIGPGGGLLIPAARHGVEGFSGSAEATESRVDITQRGKEPIPKNHISATNGEADTKSRHAVLGSSPSRQVAVARGIELIEPDGRARASSGALRNIIDKARSGGVVGGVMDDVPEEAIKDRWLIPSTYIRGELVVRGDALLWEILGDSGYDPGQPETRDSFRPGDRVIVDLSDNRPSPSGPFLVFDGIGAAIKWIEIVDRPAAEEVNLRVYSKNPRYAEMIVPESQARIIGRVRARISAM